MDRFNVSFTREDIEAAITAAEIESEKERREALASMWWLRLIIVATDTFIYGGLAAFATWFALLCASAG